MIKLIENANSLKKQLIIRKTPKGMADAGVGIGILGEYLILPFINELIDCLMVHGP